MPADKVICIDDTWVLERFEKFYFPNGLPVAGRIYSVRGTCRYAGEDGLLIVGFPALVPAEDNLDHGFLARRFRRLNEHKTRELAALKEK